MPKYFDIHSHLNLPEYDSDREETIERMIKSETKTIVVGTDLKSSITAVELAHKYPEIYACIGVHPVDEINSSFNREEFEKIIENSKVVAIGECGLDFFHADKNDLMEMKRQQELFRHQIEFAMDHNKPLMIHSRNAYVELLEILKHLKEEYGEKLRGNIHFFAGDLEIAKGFLNIGFTLSFTGVITFARNYDEVIKYVPLESIMSETDAPFVTPVPHRGKRNEPAYVSEIVKKIAEIRGEDLEIVSEVMVQNAQRMFGL